MTYKNNNNSFINQLMVEGNKWKSEVILLKTAKKKINTRLISC